MDGDGLFLLSFNIVLSGVGRGEGTTNVLLKG